MIDSESGLIVGVFVGGLGTRLGGAAKGLLLAPGSTLTLVERLLAELRAVVPLAEIVLVGSNAHYGVIRLTQVEDRPPGHGPLGGLGGLLTYAEQRGAGRVLALACDLPKLDRTLLARLTTEDPGASALVAMQSGVRNPLVARYAVGAALLAVDAALEDSRRSLQAVLDRLAPPPTLLRLSPAEEATLDDWDTPDDVRRDGA